MPTDHAKARREAAKLLARRQRWWAAWDCLRLDDRRVGRGLFRDAVENGVDLRDGAHKQARHEAVVARDLVALDALRRFLDELAHEVELAGQRAGAHDRLQLVAERRRIDFDRETADDAALLQPPDALGLGAAFLGERITRAKLAWLAAAFAGVVPVTLARPTASCVGSDYPLGVAMALGAALGWAIAALMIRWLASVAPQLVALVQLTVGAAMLAPLAAWSGPPWNPVTWTVMVTVGVVHTGLVYALMYAAARSLPTHLQGLRTVWT